MSSYPPRVLLVMPEQWPRALLRAALREAGYDALGAPGLAGALRYRPEASGRGPVELVLVDQAALTGRDSVPQLVQLARRHEQPALALLTRGVAPAPPSEAALEWRMVLRRPVSIAELVAAVQAILPLPPDSARPLD